MLEIHPVRIQPVSYTHLSTSDYQRFADSRQLLDYGFEQIQLRDASRASTGVTFTAQPDSIRPYQTASFQVQLTGVSSAYNAQAQWYVNGEAVPNYGNHNFQATAGKTSTLNYTLTEIPGETATVSFVLTMPDGTEKRADTTVAIEQRPLEYIGSLNILSAAVYPVSYTHLDVYKRQGGRSAQWSGISFRRVIF